MTEQFDFFVCKEECKDGTYKLYPCYAPSSSSIKEGDIVTIELSVFRFKRLENGDVFRFEDGGTLRYDSSEKKHGIKVVKRGSTVTVNEDDADSTLGLLGKITYKYEDVYREETK